ncbi:MAG: hypothetical protein KBT11_07680 [Treponema sp.]|nr:hypothetical protein [Candidatus Treponema equifaecale]
MEIANEELTPEEIIQTALEFSLCPLDSEEAKVCLSKFKFLLKTVKGPRFENLNERERAEEILTFLYEGVLFKYVEHSTKMNTTLFTGEYNCVTASLLFMSLARAAGIRVKGQETKIHAFCTAYIDGKNYDVETTNPFGFNPGERKEVARTENSRKYTYVPKKYYAGRHEVSDRAFATLTGKNLAADMNDTEDYDSAIPLEISRMRFLEATNDDEAKTARNDLDVLVGNYAFTLNKKKKSEEAIEYLETVTQKFGKSTELQRIYDNSVYNSCVDLLNSDKESEALDLFEEKKANMSSQMQYSVSKMITNQIQKNHETRAHNSVVPLFNSGKYSEAKKILEEALKENPTSNLLRKDLNMVNRALGS